ncbi:Cilia- and flagella-associated protein 20 [Eumeta japonica]|uniref:Cilia-and flagella-associated protein 20 n=1 Tax=Eumeta variegata TaxID=151549 RepID=A0A4C1ZC91_EUMVA|nr:Cilia- and flagella-associated protein 20 [Eumeta japonica]
MFKNVCQTGLLSIFYSIGANPLAIWNSEVHNGHIKRLTDKDVNSVVLEIISNNVQNTYITCPKNNKSLGIHMPFLVMIVKNLKRYFSFEVTILDDRNFRRRFQISNFNSTTKIKTFSTSMPIGLSGGWNQIQFNLADFTKRAYGTTFIEIIRIQIHANTRVRRVYFCDRLYSEEELPPEYKLYLPLEMKKKKSKGKMDVKTSAPEISMAAQETEITAESKPVDGEVDQLAKKTSELIAAAPSPVTVVEEPGIESVPGEGTNLGEDENRRRGG